MKFVITANTRNGHVSYQTGSAEAALSRAKTLISEASKNVLVTDMNGREYDSETFEACFVREQTPRPKRLLNS